MRSDHQSDMHFSEGERRKHSRVLRSLENATQRNQGVFETQPFTKWIVFFSGSVMVSVAGLEILTEAWGYQL